MTIFQLSPSQIEALLLIFARVGSICFSAPVLSSPRVPLQIRAGLSGLLAFLLLPAVMQAPGEVSRSIWDFALMLVTEVAVGLVIGYSANLVFSAVQMAGEMQDTQAGFGFAGVVDPNVSQHSAILGQFQMVLMWLIFLTVNGHHVLLQAIADSFRAIPLGGGAYNSGLAPHMVGVVTTLMFVAIKIGAPIIGSVLLTDLALGMLQRTAPQLNLMAVGFQAKIAVAVTVTVLVLPFLVGMQRSLVPLMERFVHEAFVLLR